MATNTVKHIQLALEYFLTKKGAYDEYLENVNIKYEYNDYYDCISGYFSWSDTKQGHKYWNRIDSEWIEFYSNIKTIKDTKIGRKMNKDRIIAEENGYIICHI